MKVLQLILVFILAFSLGAYVATQENSVAAVAIICQHQSEQGCKTDLLVVFPFSSPPDSCQGDEHALRPLR
ncbi:MAG: hypothetical protein R3E79_09945 [Caldilineaceae bacterium]